MAATTFFTLCSANYLAQARVLGDSLLRWNPGVRFVIGLVDRMDSRLRSVVPATWEVLEVERLGIEGLADMCERYDIVELNTAVKPFYIEHLFASDAQVDRVIYLDPDMMVFDSFAPVVAALDRAPMILSPHVLTPLPTEAPRGSFLVDGQRVSERLFLATGIYNLGFVGVTRSVEASRCLAWWKERVRLNCLKKLELGLFVDQLWMNLAPIFFDRIEILRHAGCNVAYWNLHERTITPRDGGYDVNGIDPLIFFHFSAYDPSRPLEICRWFSRHPLADRPDLVPIFEAYREALLSAGYERLKTVPCALPLRRDPSETRGLVRRALLSTLGSSARLLPRVAKVQLGRLGRLCLRLEQA